MSHRTVVVSSFSEYLASGDLSPAGRTADEQERSDRMVRFPYSVMLQVSFAELDFANRWCWETFGPSDGECMEKWSEYSACNRIDSHEGKWTSNWFVKTDYNFGFNEWYFAENADREQFLANVDNINWGVHYPK